MSCKRERKKITTAELHHHAKRTKSDDLLISITVSFT